MPASDHNARGFVSRTAVSLASGTLALNLILIGGLVGLIAVNGLGFFWQKPVELFALADGTRYLGVIQERTTQADGEGTRVRLKVGNRDLTGRDFVWVDEDQVEETSFPADAFVLERLEWGNFYGFPVELRRGEEVLASGSQAVSEALPALLERKEAQRDAIRDLEKDRIGDVNYAIDQLRLARRRLEFSGAGDRERAQREAEIAAEEARRQAQYQSLVDELAKRREEFRAETLVMQSAQGRTAEIPAGFVVRAIPANTLSTAGRSGLYLSRLWEFLSAEPRESNTEGGIFPAIFGTVMMVFLMALAVVPFGVLAAVYLREYAKEGTLVRLVRIAVNNLAGVPSIVFGVFGLGFFVYLVGGSIDNLFYREALPTPTYGTGGILWAALTLALLTVPVVIVATEEGLAAVPRSVREGSRALGATKFETIFRVVLPSAAPGILTGLILAMARAAGEVAPLMIVGMVKLAPTLPVDGHAPFVHLERKFMHLGFHIYDVGFQSPNVEAVKPLVFATALLLVLVVLATNVVAIVMRNRLRAKYTVSAI
jgi:phosphate transport system permease protein